MAKEYVAGNGNFKSAIDFDTLNARFFDNAQEIDIANYVVNSANQQKSKDDLETVRKNEEKEEEAKSNFAGMVEKIESDREEQERERIREQQDDYSKTFSNDEIDMMDWKIDPNTVWTIGGTTTSVANLLNAGKNARNRWNNSVAAQNMSPEDRAKVDQQFSQYLQAIKNGDYELARQIYGQMPPEARAHIDEQNSKKLDNGSNVELQSNGRSSSNEVISANAGASIFVLPSSNKVETDLNTKNVELATGSGVKSETVLRAEFNPLGLNTLSQSIKTQTNEISPLPNSNPPIMVSNFETGNLNL